MLIGSKNDSYFEHIDAPLPKVSNINKFRFVGSFLEVNPSISPQKKRTRGRRQERSEERSGQTQDRSGRQQIDKDDAREDRARKESQRRQAQTSWRHFWPGEAKKVAPHHGRDLR